MQADVQAAARSEMAKEKARIYGKETKQLSTLEQQAERWEREREREEWEIKAKEEQRSEGAEETPLPLCPPAPLRGEEAGWVQYNPWRKPGEEREEKTRVVNTATIWCFAKKMIAREWARARGIKRRDPRIYTMEQEAAEWKNRKEEEKRRVEERNRRIQRQRELSEESLRVFGEKLLQGRGNLPAERATEIFEDALESVGEVVDVNWAEEGCDVWIEPWEEKRLRRQRRDPLPVLYKLKIDSDLEVASCDPVEDREARVQKQGDRLTKLLQTSTAELLGADDETVRKVLEDTLEEAGRIVEVRRGGDEWSVEIEPWEEMRVRNIERGGRPPIVSYQVKAKVAEGKLELVK